MELRDDMHYIDQVIAGDTAAFAVLVDRHKDLVFTIAMNISRSREDAEEIAQDAFVKAFQKLASFRRDSRFSTWLYRIAYNEAISRVRKHHLQTVLLEEELTESIPDEQVEEEISGMDVQEQKAVISKILGKLPEIDQVLVSLFYLSGQTVAGISEVTGLGESNVKVRLHRIRKKLYVELNEIVKKKDCSIFK